MSGRFFNNGAIYPTPQDINRVYDWIEDFTGEGAAYATSGTTWVYATSGTTGATLDKVDGGASRFGVVRFQTGTNSAGATELFLSSAAATANPLYTLGTEELVFEAGIITGANMPDGTDTYSFTVGLRDSNSYVSRVDIGYNYLSGLLQWRGATTAASSTTTSALGATPAISASTGYRLKFVATTSRVDWYVNDYYLGNATLTIPSAAMHPFARITKTAGTTNRLAYLDLVRIRKTFAAGRF